MLVEWLEGNDEARMTNDEKKRDHSSFVIRHSLFSSAVTLSLLAAREACLEGGVLVVIDPAGTFYPPGAVSWGINLDQLIVVRPRSPRDQLWAAVQSLRSPAVAAVWTAMERIDDRAFRRLQLAAHAGNTLGCLVRPATARSEPSWADVRLGISREQGARSREFLFSPRSPLLAPRSIHVHVLRCRHGRAGAAAWIKIDDVAHKVHEVDGGDQSATTGRLSNRFADSP
jgi:hypothetical protein